MQTITTFLKALLIVALVAGIGFIVGSLFDKVFLGVSLCLMLGLFWYVYSSQRLLALVKSNNLNSEPASLLSIEDRALSEIYLDKDKQIKLKNKLNTRLQKILNESADALPNGIIIVDSDSKVLWVNQKATTYLGVRDPEDIGTRIESLIHHLHFIKNQELKNSDYLAENSIEIDGPLDEKLRLRLTINTFAKRYRMIAVQDVSNFHRVDQMRQDFIGNASHELRTPLTVLRGYIEELLEDEKLSDTWHQPVQVMEKQTLRMQNIIEDMLTLSKLESRLSKAGDERVHLQSLVEQVSTDLLQAFQDSRKVVGTIPELIYIKGEESELYSAISNLLKNAFLYSPEHSEIQITWQDGEEESQLIVTDNGPGIPSESIQRLTERFYRIDSGRSREHGGTGLGLAIVKHALMRHEAYLSVESTLGQGSQFICNFPAIRIILANNKE